ncbi:hypothetical protein COE77_29550, partial [Bacillus toyonensis]
TKWGQTTVYFYKKNSVFFILWIQFFNLMAMGYRQISEKPHASQKIQKTVHQDGFTFYILLVI